MDLVWGCYWLSWPLALKPGVFPLNYTLASVWEHLEVLMLQSSQDMLEFLEVGYCMFNFKSFTSDSTVRLRQRSTYLLDWEMGLLPNPFSQLPSSIHSPSLPLLHPVLWATPLLCSSNWTEIQDPLASASRECKFQCVPTRFSCSCIFGCILITDGFLSLPL